MPKITKTVVDNALPAPKRSFIWDSEIKGFGLKVMPTGVKVFVFQYRTAEGDTRRMALGKYSDTFTAEQARNKAKAMRRMVEDGLDPLGEKQEDRQSMTVSELLDEYIKSGRFAEKAESTRASDRGRVERHLKPTLGKQYVKKLTTDAVRRAFAAIRDGKTAGDSKTDKKRGRSIVRGGEGAARMSVRLLGAVLTWGIKEGHATTNPAWGVDIGTDGARDVILENAADYAEMFRAIAKLENEKQIRSPAADAIRVIALTGARKGEITGLRWRHVNLERGVIELTHKEHKTGGKTKKPRQINLPAVAQAIIAKQPAGKPDDFVFQPAKGEGAITLSKPWLLIRTAAELPEGLVIHGLRHSLASSMAMAGAEAAEIMTALGHRQLSTAQKYVHWSQDARSGLAERAASTVLAGLAESKGVVPADVVELRKNAKADK
jgi:integrase